MLVVERVLGNVNEDPEWAREYEVRSESAVERVVLGDRDRRRSRIRTTTEAGTDVGIVVEDDHDLSPGDVLADGDRLIVVTFEDREALVVSLEGTDAATDTVVAMTELGYQVGNRHWDLAVRDGEVLVALGTDSERKVSEIQAALPPGARTRRELVDPTLFDGSPGHGGADGSGDHTHVPTAPLVDGSAHAHEHGHDDEHDHEHGHVDEHDHEHGHDDEHDHEHGHDDEHDHEHGHDDEHDHEHGATDRSESPDEREGER